MTAGGGGGGGDLITYRYINRLNDKLPGYLDDLLFNTLNASFCPEPCKVNINLNSEGSMLRKYLGTYFPRSYMEFVHIASNLFAHPVVDSIIPSKTKIRILDIGSGTGGCLLGTLEALLKMKNFSSEIQIISVDGNAEALEIQEKILSCFLKRKNTSRFGIN
jgi:hypothetical protein